MNQSKKFSPLVLAALTVASLPAFAASATNFGTAAAAVKPAAASVAGTGGTTVSPQPASTGPLAGDTLRFVKPDGNTVIQQGSLSAGTSGLATITLSDKDAFLTSNGKCAFNVRYDEMSRVAVTGTSNRLYSNDTLIAQNTKIDLQPNILKSIWTQPYLVAGTNNIRVVVNADSATPSTKWLRVNVTGTCGAAVPVTPPPTTKPTEPTKPTQTTPPAKPPVQPPVVTFTPGSTEWNNLNNIWGYSNYATTQLKGKGYARYTELSSLNAAVTSVINAKSVTQTTYNSLATTWNTFVTEPAFKSLMASTVPNTTGEKK